MGPGAPVARRRLLAAAAAVVLTPEMSGCRRPDVPPGAASGVPPDVPPDAVAAATWATDDAQRGHRLRSARANGLPPPAATRRCDVLVVGAGIAGLAAARALQRGGVADTPVLELADNPGGNSRGHVLQGQRCPLGAHYLPVPEAPAHEVIEWLHEIGLLAQRLGRTVADERHLCHSPQERLFVDGAWHDGLLPPAEPGSRTLAQYRAFAAEVAGAQRLGFAIPTRRAPWTAAHAALDAGTFAAWLDARGLDDARLRWYLDYACRDDYGAPAAEVSAWAGLHYFASRHGFHAPGAGGGERSDGAEREAVFTWPEGNAWLVDRLAAPLRERFVAGRTVLQVRPERHGVQVLAWDHAAQRAEAWQARAVVLAVPLHVAARLVEPLPAALRSAAAALPQAPWLVANLALAEPLLDRGIGAPPAWDNVAFGSAALGYVDAGHQGLSPQPQPTVITAYHALPRAQRAALLDTPAPAWARRVVDELRPLHPDLPDKLQRVALMRHGHGMAIPVPGVRGLPALAALAAGEGLGARLRLAHADLAGYSVFEEAFTAGDEAGRDIARALRSSALR